MLWTSLLSNLVVVSGISCFSYALLQRYLENYYNQLFTSLEKCQKYHLDYVDSIAHLPLNRKVILFGTAISNNKDQPVIARSYLKKSQAEDRLWQYNFKDQFQMETGGKELVQVVPGEQETILAFNLPKGPGQSSTHEERIIHHREPVCIFGQISQMGPEGRKINPELVMGTKHENLLQYLDLEMVKISRRGKIASAVGTVLIGCHFIYKMGTRKKDQKDVLDQINKGAKSK